MNIKHIVLCISLGFFSLFVTATKPHIDYLPINSQKSTVKWKGAKITEYHDGVVSISKGVLMIDHGVLAGGEFAIDMTSITNTDIESEKYRLKLEKHLKNEDFFDVKQFPLSMLKIINAEPIEGNDYMIEADLTIKGITHRIDFVSVVNIKPGNLVIATAQIKIDRTKWGIIYKSGNFIKDLGDKAILDEIVFDVMLTTER